MKIVGKQVLEEKMQKERRSRMVWQAKPTSKEDLICTFCIGLTQVLGSVPEESSCRSCEQLSGKTIVGTRWLV